uniref:RDD family protein n=1 Tax=Flavobacterium sp. TaxID=239 RepID=UPI00404A3632
MLVFCALLITISLAIKLIHEVFLIIYFITIIDYFFAIKFCLGNLFLFFFYFKLVKYLLVQYRCKQNNQVTENVLITENRPELQNFKLSAREQLELHSIPKIVKIHRKDVIKSGILNRFTHLIIDTFLFIVCFSLVIQFIGKNSIPKFESDFINFIHELSNRDDSLYFLLFFWKFLYYLFFETCFKTTPAKILTHSMVVSAEKEEKLSFIRILGRTSARFIPFNSLSFLFKSIWHDSLSSTMVVRIEKQNEQQEIKQNVGFVE